jgi:hypothetical protein
MATGDSSPGTWSSGSRAVHTVERHLPDIEDAPRAHLPPSTGCRAVDGNHDVERSAWTGPVQAEGILVATAADGDVVVTGASLGRLSGGAFPSYRAVGVHGEDDVAVRTAGHANRRVSVLVLPGPLPDLPPAHRGLLHRPDGHRGTWTGARTPLAARSHRDHERGESGQEPRRTRTTHEPGF